MGQSMISINKEIFSTVTSKEVAEIVIDFGEMGVDALLDDGLLKDIPILGTVLKSKDVIANVRDRILMKKLGAFLVPIVNISDEDIQEFSERLSDEKERNAIGEKILILIERQDNVEKARIIGTVFSEFVKNDITHQELEMLCHAVSQGYLGDIKSLPTFLGPELKVHQNLGPMYVSLGLAEMEVEVLRISAGTFDGALLLEDADTEQGSETQIVYKLSSLGKQLAEIIQGM